MFKKNPNLSAINRIYRTNEKGQGLVEYSLILVLVAVVVILILAMLGPAVGNVFSNVIVNLGGVAFVSGGSGGGGGATATPVPTATSAAVSHTVSFTCSPSGFMDIKGIGGGAPNGPSFTCSPSATTSYTLSASFTTGMVVQFRDMYPSYQNMYTYTVP